VGRTGRHDGFGEVAFRVRELAQDGWAQAALVDGLGRGGENGGRGQGHGQGEGFGEEHCRDGCRWREREGRGK